MLRPYLRALWNRETAFGALPRGAARAVLVGDLLNLPDTPESDPCPARMLRLATAAHAGAHLAYGGTPFDRGSLKPVQAVLVGLLEDARIEWLACRDLPGLLDLWLPFHRERPAEGSDLESLLARLASDLIDPSRQDPHPWVQKGRRFFLAGTEAGRTPLEDRQALRLAASLLGNDLGQMRVQFNARAYAVVPRYRDDNNHLWIDGAREAEDAADPVRLPVETGAAPEATPAPDAIEDVSVYPEWDRLIGCHRPDWVRVHTRALPSDAPPGMGASLRAELAARASVRRSVARAIGALSRAPAAPSGQRVQDGERIDLGALIEARIDLRLRTPPDPRVFVAPRKARLPMAVSVLIDASASTARIEADGDATGAGSTVLRRAQLAALVIAGALEVAGHPCSVQAFRSNGRDEVVVHPVKDFGRAAEAPEVLTAAASLAPGWSTRIGAAVRHAGSALASRSEVHRIVLLLTDGEPHDIDIHDPAYLIDDLRMAVAASRRAGVRVVCANLAPDGQSAPERALRRAFGPGSYREVRRLDTLAPHLFALLRAATG